MKVMELRALRAFVEVVRQGGFSQAARAVFATQSTVSKAVKQLEGDLGVLLLERLGHRSELTEAGRIVYRRAQAMLVQGADMVAELDELRGLQRGRLRLGLPLLGSSTLFAPMFVTFRSRYPGIEISLLEFGSKRLEEMLLAGEIDLAASLLPTSEAFEWQPVVSEPLLAMLPREHPRAGQARIDLGQLREDPFILFEAGFALNQVLLDACRRRGFTPKVSARSGQVDFIVELVAAGLGVAFLPRNMAGTRGHPGVSAVLLDEPHTQWEMSLLWRRGGYLAHAARAWLEIAREASGSSA